MTLVTFAAMAAAFAGPAQGDTMIGINFVGKADYTLEMGALETAGVEPQSHWNNATTGNATLGSLVAADGTVTGASVTWKGKTAYSGITDTAGNNRMMRGYLTQLGTKGVTVTVSGLASLYGSEYDVTVYFDGANGASAWVTRFVIGAATIYGTDRAGTDFSGTFAQDTGTGGNYVRFVDVTGDGFTLSALPLADGVSSAAVNAIQITHAPEPATLGLIGLAAAMLLWGRRHPEKGTS
jgi:hypothetical protein